MSDRRQRGGSVFSRVSAKEDVDREVRAHLSLRAEELEQAGWSPDDARREAERLFGDREAIAVEMRRITERHDRSVRRTKMWEAMVHDLRYAARTLLRSPGFTLAGVVTLALGIGANAAIFSVIHGVLLEPLPYDDSEAIVQVQEVTSTGGTMAVAWRNFEDWDRELSSFQGLTAYSSGPTTVLGGERPMNLRVATISRDFWDVFRIVPIAGRLTTAEDHTPESAPVLVISQSLWQNDFASRPLDEIVLEVGSARAQVVGVVPAGFDFPSGAQL